jgi:carbon monoxide dehydrogenase subunit G
MITLLEREFTVGVPLQRAWEHLARVEQWPSWAPHIKQIELNPPGELGAQSTGVIHLANGLKPAFRMTEFNWPRSWKWAGPFLWATVHYDHQFEALDAGHTKLTWMVQAEGFGAGILGRLFARIYRGDLDKAIPLLIREMNGNAASDNGPAPGTRQPGAPGGDDKLGVR